MWYLYLLECQNQHYYTGITTDVERRFRQHLSGKGAKYTRANPPTKILGVLPYPDRSQASKAEHMVKRLRPCEKLAFFGKA